MTEDDDRLKLAESFLKSWSKYTMKLFTGQTQEEKAMF